MVSEIPNHPILSSAVVTDDSSAARNIKRLSSARDAHASIDQDGIRASLLPEIHRGERGRERRDGAVLAVAQFRAAHRIRNALVYGSVEAGEIFEIDPPTAGVRASSRLSSTHLMMPTETRSGSW
jgi:hypothetical protein